MLWLDRQQDHELPLRDPSQHGDDYAVVEAFEQARILQNLLTEAVNVAVQNEQGISRDRASHRPVVDQALIAPAAEIPSGRRKKLVIATIRNTQMPQPRRAPRGSLVLHPN